jgi:uncharacterized protein YjiS (DUF1127 family)
MFEYRLSTQFLGFLPHGDVRETLTLWRDRARQRRHLARLDERLLRDIGIDRVDALRESRKPFWKA